MTAEYTINVTFPTGRQILKRYSAVEYIQTMNAIIDWLGAFDATFDITFITPLRADFTVKEI